MESNTSFLLGIRLRRGSIYLCPFHLMHPPQDSLILCFTTIFSLGKERAMDTMQLQKTIDDLFDHSKEIASSSVPFDDEVRKMCEQNLCGNFGKSWTCPPAIDAPELLVEKLSSYNRFMIVDKVYTLEDSFDWEGMVSSAKDFQTRIHRLKKQIESMEPEGSFLSLGAGACQLCETCSYQQQEPCRHPADALFSVEAFGIDVMKMMADNGMSYNNGQNTVTYIGGIFWLQNQ